MTVDTVASEPASPEPGSATPATGNAARRILLGALVLTVTGVVVTLVLLLAPAASAAGGCGGG
ncbi:MAG: hypothetical protein JWM93_2252 [Frankiales bacterium]|nr:hypothetical protein [Frankiales bacterium]